ncbi:hypothetical protein [Frankia sp. R43]|uniref:hypothetical protein n=1 Tax=Frankia sp. R43 TaxID=269536 RepID=UPI0006C9F87F|nr:hypothetical protein [Frankia sp. R43]
MRYGQILDGFFTAAAYRALMRWSRVPLGLLVIVVTGAALAGCGGGKDEPRVATAGGRPTAAATATGDPVTAYVEGVRAYVACLRAEGLKVTDPNAQGKFTFEGDLQLLKSDPKFTTAQQKCKKLLPAVPSVLQSRPARTQEEIKMARDYAKCMRENGAADFPDPGPDGYYPASAPGEQGWDQTSEGARRATQACASIIGDPSATSGGVG